VRNVERSMTLKWRVSTETWKFRNGGTPGKVERQNTRILETGTPEYQNREY